MDDFLRRIMAAQSADERHWIVTENLLNSLRPDLAQLAYAATIPHWFDAGILAALRPALAEQAEKLYADLQRLPFVEPFARRGHNVHELTRRLMLAHLWQSNREEFVALSRRAAEYFNHVMSAPVQPLLELIPVWQKDELSDDEIRARIQAWQTEHAAETTPPEPHMQIEFIYHLLIADADAGANAVRDQGLAWHDEFDYTYASLNALARAVREHADAGRVDGRAKGWGNFFEALIAQYTYESHKAIELFNSVLTANYPDNQLNANCIQRLGDVHVRLSELPQARARYEEALPLYRSIGDKLGEANCIQRLGNVHVALSELPQARARYEEALPLYRSIGERVGEANCIQALGNVHGALSELPQARARYEEALPLYRSIGERVGEANCIKALGNVHVALSELPQARARYEEALPIFRSIGDKLGEAKCIKALGNVHVQEKDFETAFKLYEEAITIARTISPSDEASALNTLANAYDEQKEHVKAIEMYTRAIDIFPNQPMWYRNRANQYLKLKDVENAARDIEAAAHLQPDNAYLFLRRGELAILRSNYDAAIQQFEATLERYPRMNGAHFGIGMAHLRSGRVADARAAYERGLAVSDARKDLDDAIEELEELQREQSSLAGVDEMLTRLRTWQPEKQ